MKKGTIKPLISVIVPIYNVESYVERCIESIQNQTYGNLEIILVDDGSTDQSGEICDEYAMNDSRIRVIHKKNGGLVSARKTGIQEAKGVYATYVDGDDWIEPNMYEELIYQIKSADVIVSGLIRDYDNYILYEKNRIPDGYYRANELRDQIYQTMIYTGKFFERGILTHVWNSLYKKELLLKNQMKVSDNIRIAEDIACIYPLLLDAKEVVISSECYYHYRMRENSLMGINDGEELSRFKILYKYLKKRFTEKDDLKDSLLYQLDYLMIYCLLLKEIKILQDNDGIFPYKEVREGDRLIIYGAGRFGNELVNYIKGRKEYTIVSWIDEGGKKGSINKINELDFDCILIAALIHEIVEEIENKILSIGISKNKIKKPDLIEINAKKEKIRSILNSE